MVILLSLTLIFTLIPMTAFADDRTVTITLKASTIDGKTPVSDIKLHIEKGESLQYYFGTNDGELERVVKNFTTKEYAPIRTNIIKKEGDKIELTQDVLMVLPKSFGNYRNYTYSDLNEKHTQYNTKIFEDCTLYVPMAKIINTVNLRIESPLCGTKIGYDEETGSQTNTPNVTESSNYYDVLLTQWTENDSPGFPFSGEIVVGEKYTAGIAVFASVGYLISNKAKANIENGEFETAGTPHCQDVGDVYFVVQARRIDAVHNWDSGEVTKEPTLSAEGVKTYTCEGCKITKTESIPKLQKGSDGTEVGPGASEEIADQKITGMKTDTDPKGSKFNKLRLRSVKQTKTSITLKWKSNSKAVKYVIYGNRCGSSTKIRKSVKLYTVKKSTKTTMTKVIKKVKGAKLKKNTYYKFLIVALNKNNKVVSTSRMIHVATKGGKYTNYKKISVDKEKITKAKNLKKGKSLKLEAKQIKVTKSLKARKHVPIRYESSNKNIAKVTSKGVIKALKKGTCYVYVYAQNGVYKKIKVVVK